jgi:hypothetical protein
MASPFVLRIWLSISNPGEGSSTPLYKHMHITALQIGFESRTLTSLSVSNETKTSHDSLPLSSEEADLAFSSVASTSGALDEQMLMNSVLRTLSKGKPQTHCHVVCMTIDGVCIGEYTY